MGYEGHLIMVEGRDQQRTEVEHSMEILRQAHADVGGEIMSAGGTGSVDLHDAPGVIELQAGSDALMDTHDGTLPIPPALFVVGTAISVRRDRAVADVGS